VRFPCAHALGALKVVRYRCDSRTIVQRSKITVELSGLLKALGISMPSRFFRSKRRLQPPPRLTAEAIARGRDGQFVPAGICWVVKRSFGGPSRYRRLNTIFERSKEHLIAFIAIAFISILSRRLKRRVIEEVCARHLQTNTQSNLVLQSVSQRTVRATNKQTLKVRCAVMNSTLEHDHAFAESRGCRPPSGARHDPPGTTRFPRC
jgi:hypothetical protein